MFIQLDRINESSLQLYFFYKHTVSVYYCYIPHQLGSMKHFLHHNTCSCPYAVPSSQLLTAAHSVYIPVQIALSEQTRYYNLTAQIVDSTSGLIRSLPFVLSRVFLINEHYSCYMCKELVDAM